MLAAAPVRLLDARDLPAVQRLLAVDPVTNVLVASRLHASGLETWRLGGELWGFYRDGELVSLCLVGPNMVPVGSDPEALSAFAGQAARQGRRCTTLVGPAVAVGLLWKALEPAWGPARDVRPRQPLLAIDSAPLIAPDPLVRRVRLDEVDLLLPSCVAMFTEEVGVPPFAPGGEAFYRARVEDLVRAGRSFARIEDGRVVFKAEIGSVSPHACQVQGVWVTPEMRGQGLSGSGMATVVEATLRDIAPVVSLYVNDYNTAARAAYRRVGFSERGAFMSVLF